MRRCLAAAVLVATLGLAPAAAQTYPSKPIKVIVPLTPGSPVDVLARVATQHLSMRLNQPIIIDNRPGAGTTIGTKVAADAAPDGYTLVLVSTSFIISSSLYPKLEYDPIKSFSPVAMLAVAPQNMVITSALPVKTLPEFVAYAKAHPGELNFGFGLGTLPQILGETFKVLTGTDIASIPYRGGAQAVTDMLGGRIHMNFGTQATLLPLIHQGRIRALAVTTDTRSKALPDVPTMIESGLPDLTIGFTAGILAPAGTPQPIIETLNRAMNEALRTPEMIEALDKLGFDPVNWSAKQYGDFLADEMKRLPPMVKAAGVLPE
jgi:tripartite-type tricarboxylate transporter receptor subunit TctC